MGFAVMLAAIYVMLGIGVQLWYSGRMLFLGSGLFMGAAAFTATGLSVELGWPVVPSIAVGIVVGLGLALPIGRLLLHLEGLYLALASLALAEVLRIWAFNFPEVTGGARGRIVPVIVNPAVVLLVTASALAFSAWLQRGHRGLVLATLRFDPRIAGTIGVGVTRLKWRVFLAGVLVTAVAGTMHAYFVRFVSPQQYGFSLVITAFAVALIGGATHWAGPVLGALLLGLVPEYLRFAQSYSRIMFGIVLVLVLVFAPEGIIAPVLRGIRSLRARPRHADDRPGEGWDLARQAVDGGQTVIGASRQRPADDVPLVHARAIGFSYGGVRAVHDASVMISAGEVVGLVGPNGAGKTTLLNCFSGMATPDEGEVLVAGQLAALPEEFAALRLRRTFQRVQLVPELTVWDNVVTAAKLADLPGDAEHRTRVVLLELGLAALAHKRPGGLPLGVRRLVELARALVSEPLVLLLDEPTSGSDPPSIESIERAVRAVASAGGAVLIVSHDVPSIERIADRVILMDLGEVVTSMPASQLATDPHVRRVYVGEGLGA